MYSVLPAAVSMLFLSYGLYALASRGINRITASFFLLCITTFFWQATWAVLFQTEDPAIAGFLVKFGYLFILFLPTSMYHFLAEITERNGELRRVYISYAVSALLAIVLVSSDLFVSGHYHYLWGYYPKAGILHPLHVLQTTAIVARGIQMTYQTQQTALADKRVQLHLCLATLLFFALSGIDYLCNYGIDFYPPGVVFLAASLVFFTIAIINYDLFNPMALAGTIAHEMRTPLAAIRIQAFGISRYLPTLLNGYQLAVENKLTHASISERHLHVLSEISSRIADEVHKSNVMIDMMLASTSMERPEAIAFERLFVGTCVAEALDRYPFEPGEKEKVSLEIAENFEFQGSNTLLVFVLFNLFKNAIYALKAAGKGDIRISTRTAQGRNLLCVTDTGPGIPAHVLPRIFKPFYSTKRKGGGTGIGLAFCKKVMTAFNGTIECESVEGEYTTFILAFPVV